MLAAKVFSKISRPFFSLLIGENTYAVMLGFKFILRNNVMKPFSAITSDYSAIQINVYHIYIC